MMDLSVLGYSSEGPFLIRGVQVSVLMKAQFGHLYFCKCKVYEALSSLAGIKRATILVQVKCAHFKYYEF